MTHDSQTPQTPANDNDREPAFTGAVEPPDHACSEADELSVTEPAASPADRRDHPGPEQRNQAGPAGEVQRAKERKAARLNMRLVPDIPRDELHHARILDLQEQVHRLARSNLRDGFLEEDPGPRGIFINAGVKLAAAYLTLMNAEVVIRARLDQGTE